jgi:sugar phosphate isomerase/epimerase
MPFDPAWPIAVEFCGRLAEIAAREGTVIVLEANPPEYGADFVTRASEALAMVRAVDHPGLRLHLDAACMTLAGDDPSIITDARQELKHFHASEPNLAPLGSAGVAHQLFATRLQSIGYTGFVSIEMREVEPFRLDSLRDAVRLAQREYCCRGDSAERK